MVDVLGFSGDLSHDRGLVVDHVTKGLDARSRA